MDQHIKGPGYGCLSNYRLRQIIFSTNCTQTKFGQISFLIGKKGRGDGENVGGGHRLKDGM